MFCGKCGTVITETDRFCPVCGAPVTAAPAEQPAYQQPVQQPTYQQPVQQQPVQQPVQQQPYQQPYQQPAYQQPAYQQQPYQQQAYGAAPAKQKSKLLPILLIGAVVLIAAALLIYFLVIKPGGGSGGSVAAPKQSEPLPIAQDIVRAYCEDNYATLALYTTFDLKNQLLKTAVANFGSEQEFYSYISSSYGYTVNNIDQAINAQYDYSKKELIDEYGEDYQIILTLDESQSKTFTGSDIAAAIEDESSSYFQIEGVNVLDTIDISNISELRLYHFEAETKGSKDNYSTWYEVYLAKIGNEWKLIGLY